MRKYNERIKKKVTMHEMKQEEDFMKVRIELRIFVQHCQVSSLEDYENIM